MIGVFFVNHNNDDFSNHTRVYANEVARWGPQMARDGAGLLKGQRVETFGSFVLGPTLQPPGRRRGAGDVNNFNNEIC